MIPITPPEISYPKKRRKGKYEIEAKPWYLALKPWTNRRIVHGSTQNQVDQSNKKY
jgi:hypothetical protein